MSYFQITRNFSVSATTTKLYEAVGADCRIRAIRLVTDGQTADNSANYTFEISVGGTTIASRVNNVAGGAYVDGVSEALTLQNQASTALNAGDVIRIDATKASSAANLKGSINIICELSRDFS